MTTPPEQQSPVPVQPVSKPPELPLSSTLPPTPGLTSTNTGNVKRISAAPSPLISSNPHHPLDASPFERHPVHWYPKGDVVIQIGTTKFRLYQHLLAQQSHTFVELFEKKVFNGHGGGDGNEVTIRAYGSSTWLLADAYQSFTIEGVEAEDFAVMMDVLIDTIDIYYKPPPFPALASILRISTSLQFFRWHSWAVRYLEETWPRELTRLTPTPSLDNIAHAVECVALARQCGVPSVLKRAFYEILRKGWELSIGGRGVAIGTAIAPEGQLKRQAKWRANLNAEATGDGAVNIGVGSGDEQLAKGDENNKGDDHGDPKPITVSSTDLLHLFVARDKLTSAWVAMLTNAPVFPACPLTTTADGPCVSAEQQNAEWAVLVHDSGMFGGFFYDPICGLGYLVEEVDWAGEGYCKVCVQARVGVWRRKREELWQGLDAWLAL